MKEEKGKWFSNVRLPLLLYPILFVLAYTLSANFFRFTELNNGLDLSTTERAFESLYLLFSTVISSELTIRTMVKISRAERTSWGLACRTMFVQLFIIVMNKFILSRMSQPLLDISETYVAIACVISIGILFLPSIRKRYVPPMMDMPPIKDWIPFIFYKNKDRKFRYAFGYDKDRPDQETISFSLPVSAASLICMAILAPVLIPG